MSLQQVSSMFSMIATAPGTRASSEAAVSVAASAQTAEAAAAAAAACAGVQEAGVVHLDVGGTRFRTAASTLRRAPFFEALLRLRAEGHLNSTEVGDSAIFVDRSPRCFEEVLEFLRTGEAFAESPLQQRRLRGEFAFYGLDPDMVQLAPTTRVETAMVRAQLNEYKGMLRISISLPEGIMQRVQELPALSNMQRLADAGLLIWECQGMDESKMYEELCKWVKALQQLGFYEVKRSEMARQGTNSGVCIKESVIMRRDVGDIAF